MADIINIGDRLPAGTEPWVTKRQLAAHLQISERWIELRMREGMPHWKMRRGAVRFKVGDVEEWLRQGGREA